MGRSQARITGFFQSKSNHEESQQSQGTTSISNPEAETQDVQPLKQQRLNPMDLETTVTKDDNIVAKDDILGQGSIHEEDDMSNEDDMSEEYTVPAEDEELEKNNVAEDDNAPNENDVAEQSSVQTIPILDPIQDDIPSVERDPGKRKPIWKFPLEKRDTIRRIYIALGPYQHKLSEYPWNNEASPRRFQASWFSSFSWLEYSPIKDRAFCLPCYLFCKPNDPSSFITKGFNRWRKVGGKNYALLLHVGKGVNSSHNKAMEDYQNLIRQPQHIANIFEKKNSSQIAINRLRLKTSIDSIKWLTFQGCAFRGHDEGENSRNQGNFLELVKLLGSYNKEVGDVILDKAPGNAKYIAPKIQKQILHMIARKVQRWIREEIGNSKFCIMVDEAQDESRKEQMAIVLRFVDKKGFVRERFFDIVHVPNTSASTLKEAISGVLSHHNLNVLNLRGQSYDGASNMRGYWNGLQAKFLEECPYAYFVHCMAHRLQLTLVASSRVVMQVHQFYRILAHVINIVIASPKRNDELQVIQAQVIEKLLADDKLISGRGRNQIGTLQQAGDTRWSSNFNSIYSLWRMFKATCTVLKGVINFHGSTHAQRGDADDAFKTINTFEFVFILHLMREVMEITNDLCIALQRKSQDIINAMDLVRATKEALQHFRGDESWETLFEAVILFCKEHDIPHLEISEDDPSFKHYFQTQIFYATVDSQINELGDRFQDDTIELLKLSTAFDLKDNYKAFNVNSLCKLASQYYPEDFTEQEHLHLKYQLNNYARDVPRHQDLQNVKTIGEVCQGLERTGKAEMYPLVDRLLRLVLTLPVSTATTERAFSAMNIVKTRLRTKMEDEFLSNYLIVYIEKEIAAQFSTDSIIDEFSQMKERRAQLETR